ncbi:MAG TPA: hypothetical protein VJY35_00655 [Candidatus Eisenbacteria bacterium]|nr:hypothetical protein [Candidatus Eisenbacteria bacterium]
MRWYTRMSLVMLLAVTLVPPAHALKMSAVDLMTSTVMQEGQSSFSGLALRTRLKSPMFIDGIEFMPQIEYWRNANSLDPFGIHTTRKDATLGADVRYLFGGGGMKPYIGGGYAIHFLSTTVDAPSLGLNNESHALTKGGFAALGGLSFPLTTRIENFVELKYHHIPDYRQLKFNWGLSINL